MKDDYHGRCELCGTDWENAQFNGCPECLKKKASWDVGADTNTTLTPLCDSIVTITGSTKKYRDMMAIGNSVNLGNTQSAKIFLMNTVLNGKVGVMDTPVSSEDCLAVPQTQDC